MALPAFAAARRAVAPLLLTAGPPAVQQSIDISQLPGPQQQTRSCGMRRPDGTDGQTDVRQLHRPELSRGPFCVTRSNPTHYKWRNLDPTQPNTTNNGVYSLVVTVSSTRQIDCKIKFNCLVQPHLI